MSRKRKKTQHSVSEPRPSFDSPEALSNALNPSFTTQPVNIPDPASRTRNAPQSQDITAQATTVARVVAVLVGVGGFILGVVTHEFWPCVIGGFAIASGLYKFTFFLTCKILKPDISRHIVREDVEHRGNIRVETTHYHPDSEIDMREFIKARRDVRNAVGAIIAFILICAFFWFMSWILSK